MRPRVGARGEPYGYANSAGLRCASMRPTAGARGERKNSPERRRPWKSFNAARGGRPWRTDCERWTLPGVAALQCGHGWAPVENVEGLILSESAVAMLQCGHGWA